MNRIPKLRFPEFSGEWEEKKFGDLVKKEKKITYGVVKPGNYAKDGVSLIKASDYSNKWNINNLFKISKELDFSYRRSKVQEGDLLFTIVGSVGNIAIVPKELSGANITQQTARMSIDDSFSNIFIYNFLMTESNKKETINYLKEGVQPSVNLSDLEKFKINLPSLPEQEEIASFLSSVDFKIEKLERKKELWEQYKKGMMQKIFSQELRFRDENGEDYPEWEEKKICEITLKLYQGINTAADKVEYSEEGIPILQAKHITSGKLTFEDTKYLNIDRYSEYTKNYIPEENEILFSNIGTIGKSVLIKQKESFLIAWNILKITLNLSKIYPSYFLQTLKFFDYRKVFSQLETGNATKFINKGDFENISINLPSLPEQAQIADFLSSIDSKIEIVEKELLGMKEFKKGLLQKMFV